MNARKSLLLCCLLAAFVAAQVDSSDDRLTEACRDAAKTFGGEAALTKAEAKFISDNQGCLSASSGTNTCDSGLEDLRDACATAGGCVFSIQLTADTADTSIDTTSYFCGPTECNNDDDVAEFTRVNKAILEAAIASAGVDADVGAVVEGCPSSPVAIIVVVVVVVLLIAVAAAFFIKKKGLCSKSDGGEAASTADDDAV
eukprot:PLAT3327.8.p3 GENE.PLAT3327.8~~PLAT3327.8.p3  ORF type:complete len:200 (-),score=81.75 PLAT3327.8:170-769(-)